MAIFQRFRSGARSDVVVECRRCGTTVDSPDQRCPACGSSEIARYEI